MLLPAVDGADLGMDNLACIIFIPAYSGYIRWMEACTRCLVIACVLLMEVIVHEHMEAFQKAGLLWSQMKPCPHIAYISIGFWGHFSLLVVPKYVQDMILCTMMTGFWIAGRLHHGI